MNKDNEKHFGLRVDGDILAKFRYVCGYVGRSANSQIFTAGVRIASLPCGKMTVSLRVKKPR